MDTQKIEELIVDENIDDATRAHADELFQTLATECKWHVIDELEFEEVDEETEYKLCSSREYIDNFQKLFGREPFFMEFTSYGQYYDDEDGHRTILIHGYPSNIGLTNWIEDETQFEKLVNALLELTAENYRQRVIIRDRDFAKVMFELIQEKHQKFLKK